MIDRLDQDTLLSSDGRFLYQGAIDPGWWIVTGPNGGYVAALMLRAMLETVGDEQRRPRSLTVHFTAPPREGPCMVRTSIEREGYKLMTVTARLEQEDRLAALAIGAFSKSRESLEFQQTSMPAVPPPEQCPLLERPPERLLPVGARWETRPCIGDALHSGSDTALTGGWIRPSSPRLIDPLLCAALTDAWPPAIFTRLRDDEPPMAVPTIDLSVHFRGQLPYEGAKPDDYYLVEFRSDTARDGFIEEDGIVWSRSGTLLAHSRQLSVLR